MEIIYPLNLMAICSFDLLKGVKINYGIHLDKFGYEPKREKVSMKILTANDRHLLWRIN